MTLAGCAVFDRMTAAQKIAPNPGITERQDNLRRLPADTASASAPSVVSAGGCGRAAAAYSAFLRQTESTTLSPLSLKTHEQAWKSNDKARKWSD